MNQGIADLVETAFLQLSFAIKLWWFLVEHQIEKDDFDIALTIEDEGSRISLPLNEFPNYDAIRVASEHNISICFGVAENTLWEAMRERNGLEARDLVPNADRGSNIASLPYMIRCCFAHGDAGVANPGREVPDAVPGGQQGDRPVDHRRWCTLRLRIDRWL